MMVCEINPEDLEISVYGGHMMKRGFNKIRITHKPTELFELGYEDEKSEILEKLKARILLTEFWKRNWKHRVGEKND